MARDVFYQDMYQYNSTAVFSQANDFEQSFVQYTFCHIMPQIFKKGSGHDELSVGDMISKVTEYGYCLYISSPCCQPAAKGTCIISLNGSSYYSTLITSLH
jgi:hypothetical protein